MKSMGHKKIQDIMMELTHEYNFHILTDKNTV